MQTLGPVLFLDAATPDGLHLAALFLGPKGQQPPPVVTEDGTSPALPIADYDHVTVWRARFHLPPRPSGYRWNGTTFPVQGDLSGPLRLAYVSCNGEEIGDLGREGSERNAMWATLGRDHQAEPFALLLHGGDQVYADEATDGHPLTEGWPDHLPDTPSAVALADLRHHLRERFMERYAALYAAPEFAWAVARIPSLMQWDDHDICDGWGSLRRKATESAIGRTLFDAAREAFLIFQAAAPEGDLPARFADPSGAHLGWEVRAPGLRLLAPDLRSERTRHRIMGDGGWAFMDGQAPLDGEKCLLMSSVPLLGPRLSLLESVMMLVPRMQRFEDDLRDQWQSHAHRAEWQRMLRRMVTLGPGGGDIAVLSGEIHLAGRGTMPLGDGVTLNQLVASGISHRPPPKGWARFLGALSSLGDAPLPGHPIRIRRIPGQFGRYVAQRNYLTLRREHGAWQAQWQLEESGTSPALPL
ncbi:alkaline phosphatase D family protein [Falsirhodobacter sp. 20TX0035]|uniref:alkaline phosphatase D family protein n=1 Tax=Falsirhodobacter sp. 20TX0035 TaxID=3022019 RepID=UPI00232C0B4B|nr:alkaline phosphatase D family protein [Falsirhodobacter sp. 20TX0035]MDB6454490.1 alkaline phosphatase D family protein [Falsirhodobacter sp. 20TX0035]